MAIYAQINEDGYCYGILQAGGSGTYENMIPVPQYDLSYIGRKYDRKEKQWIDEYMEAEEAKEEPKGEQEGILLQILANQQAQDQALAAILLSQQAEA